MNLMQSSVKTMQLKNDAILVFHVEMKRDSDSQHVSNNTTKLKHFVGETYNDCLIKKYVTFGKVSSQ